jgi:hypothetical protein
MNILSVNLEKLNDEIDKFVSTNNRSPYIICSEKTTDLMAYNVKLDSSHFMCSSNYIERRNKELLDVNYVNGVYVGVKILIDNSLKLGEVEVR